MPGADWIGPAPVGRVGSGRLGRGLEPACAGKGPSRAAAPARARSGAFPGFRGRPGPVSRLALLSVSSACLGPRGGRLTGHEPLPALTGAESPWAQLSARDPPGGGWREESARAPVVAGEVSEWLPSLSAATELIGRPVQSAVGSLGVT